VVGSGPRGTVYRARGPRGTVAVKVLRPGIGADRAVLARFLRGAPDQLRHPNLPRLEAIHDLDGGGLAYSMTFLGGDSLEVILDDLHRRESRRPSLSALAVGAKGELHPELPRRAAELIAEVAEGLGLAHAQGIAHRRITPRNLILNPAGRLVLTDFGGEPRDPDAKEIAMRLAPYRAPEALSGGLAGSGPAADVYALGVILYELLARRLPFAGEDAAAITRAAKRGRPPPLDGVPSGLAACVHRAIARAPAERYADAGALSRDLYRFLRDDVSEALAGRTATTAAPPTATAAAAVSTATLGSRLRALAARGVFLRAAALIVFAILVVFAYRSGSRLRPGSTRDGTRTTAVHLDPARRSSGREARGAEGPESAAPAAGARDPVLAGIETAEPAARVAALERLGYEIASRMRPPEDARLAARLLYTKDAEVRYRALELLCRSGQVAVLLEALRLSLREDDAAQPLVLEARSFDLLFDSLLEAAGSREDPGPGDEALRLLCGWDLDTCRALDGAPRPGAVLLSPNLRVLLSPDTPPGFTAGWIGSRPALDPEGLVRAVPSLATEPDLVPVIIPALAAVATPEAIEAVERLAKSDPLTAGGPALKALAEMRSPGALLDLASRDVPLRLRESALRALGASFRGVFFPELRALALTSPEAPLRIAAFDALAASSEPEASALLLDAVDDLVLRDAALAWLERLPWETAAPLALRLVHHRVERVRDAATAVLSRERHLEILPVVLVKLLDSRLEVRAAAGAVLAAERDRTSMTQALRQALQWALRELGTAAKLLERPPRATTF
jgi:hypothetical protein